jgi:predicted nucleotidyltransferase
MENSILIELVAKGLEELKNEVVFLGGMVTFMYADDASLSDIRPTKDVDCIVQVHSKMAYADLEEKLRKKGFKNDVYSDKPLICRFLYEGIIVDVMPTDTDILGFSNKWYKAGFENRVLYQLTTETTIYILPVEYYLATKFEALLGRGGTDLRISHDFEDIIYIVQNNANLVSSVQLANLEVQKYLKEQFKSILEDKNNRESVEAVLPYNSSIEEIEFVLEKIKELINC